MAKSTEAVLTELQARITAGYPALYLRSWEEDRWERLLADLALEVERGVVTWTITAGLQPPAFSKPDRDDGPLGWLDDWAEYPSDHLCLVKDFHPYFADPQVVRRLRDLLPVLSEQRKTLIFLDPVATVPLELQKDVIRLELPLPGYEDLRDELTTTLQLLRETGTALPGLSEDDEDHLIKAMMGLTLVEARKAWTRSLAGRTALSDDVFTELISEKRSMASGSDLLEFYDLEENVADIGGLDELKDWLKRRSEAYSPRAREQGIPLPRGMLLLGVQGCGKSLTARATARLLSFPLIRLDIANLLGSARGESERNMRSVLTLVESIAPAVLWLDEIEKGFAGAEGDGAPGTGDATMQRLIGSFLTWMGEVQKPVFVVATANSVQHLPPEMLRRGRFDELFFVDLPNFHERKHILGIHLKKRGWKPDQFDLEELAKRTEGFSGAELEQIIVTALIDAFGRGAVLSTDDLVRARRQTVPLSVTMEEKIFQLRNWAQDRCRRATSDSRVTQLLDEEQRTIGSLDADLVKNDPAKPLPPWAQLVTAGQQKAGLVEFVRKQGEALFPELQAAFAPFLAVEGEFGLAARSNPNTVLWSGLSGELCDLLCEVIATKRLYLHPVDPQRYAKLGQSLPLPLLPEPTDEKLPRPLWLPVSLRTLPHPAHGSKLARIGKMKLARGK